MREIKFRYYDKRTKEMICQVDCNFSVRLRVAKKGNEVYYEFTNMVDNTFTPDLAELMQYTGLKDKNGKEIYEGDILRDMGGTSIVKWEGIGWSPFVEDMLDANDSCNFEVIGNIYENPELLKEANK